MYMRTSGTLTTDSSGISDNTGVLGYVEAITAACSVYDSTDATGDLICTVPLNTSITFDHGVKYINGLDIVCAAGGTAIVHATHISTGGI